MSTQVQVFKDSKGDYSLSLDGPVRIKLSRDAIAQALRVVSYWRGKVGADDDAMVAGFFDVLSKGIKSIKKLTQNGLVKSVISVLPYGGAALTAVDMAGSAVALGNKALKKVPKKARVIAAAAANGNPKAIAMLEKAKRIRTPKARAFIADVAAAAALYRDRDEARGFLESGEGIESSCSDCCAEE